MLSNYFKTAIRNLIRNRSYAFITIIGLVVGLTVCILLLLYVKHEAGFDRFHRQADRIWRLCQPQHPFHSPQTAKYLADNLPEIRDWARILVQGEVAVQYRENRFKERNFAFADPALFRIFSFRFQRGDPEKALERPSTAVISESLARKYFGSQDPVGNVLTLDHQLPVTVSGVMEDMPANSHFRYDLLVSLTDAERVFGGGLMNDWGWQNFLVYFLMPEEFPAAAFEEKCNRLMARVDTGHPPMGRLSLQRLKDIHLYSRFENDIQPQNRIASLLIYSAIGFLVLLIACFNYVNLMTANATARAKEIGVRKAAGASRRHLVGQFIGESLLIMFIALLAALLLAALGLPAFNALVGGGLSRSSLGDPAALAEILGLALVTGALAGGYPALFLAARQPAGILKSDRFRGGSRFRQLLVGLQFAVVIVLICCSLLMLGQVRFLQNRPLGFDKDRVLLSELNHPADDARRFAALKQALLKESAVSSVSLGSRVPSADLSDRGELRPEGRAAATLLPFVHVHDDYFETLGIPALRGRLFSAALTSDADEAVVLNQAAVKKLELRGEPIGQWVDCNWPKSRRKIIGIVADFHFESLRQAIRPVAFVPAYERCSQLMVRIRPSVGGDPAGRLNEVCSRFYPEELFEFHFLDERLEALYQKDRDRFRIMGAFSLLAIVIAGMGLYGLGMIMIRKRTREIGIRKALGASAATIFLALTGDFSRWVVLSNLVAWPVAFYAMKRWLQNFAFRVNLTPWPFLLAGAAALAIALLTVGRQTLRAARANPVESLRCE